MAATGSCLAVSRRSVNELRSVRRWHRVPWMILMPRNLPMVTEKNQKNTTNGSMMITISINRRYKISFLQRTLRIWRARAPVVQMETCSAPLLPPERKQGNLELSWIAEQVKEEN